MQQPQRLIQPAVMTSIEDLLEDYPIYFDDDADAVLHLGSELADQLGGRRRDMGNGVRFGNINFIGVR